MANFKIRTCIPKLNENILISLFLRRDEKRRKVILWQTYQKAQEIDHSSFFSSSEIYSFSLCSNKQQKLFGHISSLFCCLILFLKMNNRIHCLFIHSNSIFTYTSYQQILNVNRIPLSLNII